MTDQECARKLDELDRLLNDPDVPMDPSRVWSLLADLSQTAAAAMPRDHAAAAAAPMARARS